MALHEQSVGATDEWYTPPHVFEAMGCEFDLDVASPGQAVTPWRRGTGGRRRTATAAPLRWCSCRTAATSASF